MRKCYLLEVSACILTNDVKFVDTIEYTRCCVVCQHISIYLKLTKVAPEYGNVQILTVKSKIPFCSYLALKCSLLVGAVLSDDIETCS